MSYPSRYSVDWQCIYLLLYALRPLINGATKETVLAKIEDERLLSLTDDDYEPYPSAWERGSHEPRWMTLIAYARDHAKNFGLIANEQVEALCRKAPTHDVDVTKCFLWSPRLKALLDPSFREELPQARGPASIYETESVE